MEAECDYCKEIFSKPLTEFNRNKEKGRRNYCSRSCVGKDNISNIPKETKVWDHLSGRKHDKYSNLRVFMRSSKSRMNKEVNITLDDLLNQWELQKGICVYSNIQLIKPKAKGSNDPIITASLDRIDSSKGYIKGNIQFVSMAMNFMKGKMSHEQTLELINIIKNS